MKTRLLRRWNRLMDGVYACGATWNMSFWQKCLYAWFRLTGLDRLGKDAHSEFTSYYAAYHGLGYGIGPGILVWDISRKGMWMHNGRVNAWDWFYRRYRRYSKRWNSPDAVLKRAVSGTDRHRPRYNTFERKASCS